jgi:hypothetical protein
MALPFFYVEDTDSEEIRLDEDTSRHVVSVLRMNEGERLHLTDGKGHLAEAEIADAHKKKCAVKIVSKRYNDADGRKTIIGISILKNRNKRDHTHDLRPHRKRTFSLRSHEGNIGKRHAAIATGMDACFASARWFWTVAEAGRDQPHRAAIYSALPAGTEKKPVRSYRQIKARADRFNRPRRRFYSRRN